LGGGVLAMFSGQLLGVLLTLLQALGSSFAGIFNEKLLKKRFDTSLHWSNAQLYLWGMGFNFMLVCIKDNAVLRTGLLAGFGPVACLVVLTNAVMGISISAVLAASAVQPMRGLSVECHGALHATRSV